jgi:hypothetical protein
MKNDSSVPCLINEILAVTLQMQAQFPEQYQMLDETPIVLTNTKQTVSRLEYETYLESIQNQMSTFEEAIPNPFILKIKYYEQRQRFQEPQKSPGQQSRRQN